MPGRGEYLWEVVGRRKYQVLSASQGSHVDDGLRTSTIQNHHLWLSCFTIPMARGSKKSLLSYKLSQQAWQFMPGMPAVRRLRQENFNQLEGSLGYTARSWPVRAEYFIKGLTL